MAIADKILIHICCAPCVCYPLEVLKNDGFDVTGYWYNPNIHGFKEYKKRLMALGYFASKNKKFDIIEGNYDIENWFKKTDEYSKPLRCSQCYHVRLNAAARTALDNGIRAFTTTLLYSKFQDHMEIKKSGEEAAKRYGVEFLYKDFREGWKEGIRISKEMGLYRQQYCGCIFSETERYVS